MNIHKEPTEWRCSPARRQLESELSDKWLRCWETFKLDWTNTLQVYQEYQKREPIAEGIEAQGNGANLKWTARHIKADPS